MIATISPSSSKQRLDNTGFTRPMGCLAAGLMALDGFNFFIILVIIPFLKRNFDPDDVTIGTIATARTVKPGNASALIAFRFLVEASTRLQAFYPCPEAMVMQT